MKHTPIDMEIKGIGALESAFVVLEIVPVAGLGTDASKYPDSSVYVHRVKELNA